MNTSAHHSKYKKRKIHDNSIYSSYEDSKGDDYDVEDNNKW